MQPLQDLKFEWKRYWCPPDGSYSTADHGFLVPPDSLMGIAVDADVVTHDDLADTPFVGLLGEPGIGKSSALSDLAAAEVASSTARFFNLAAYGAEQRLLDEVFRSEWLLRTVAEQPTTLYLDSLDECILPTQHLVPLLASELRTFDSSRLRVRIASRTAAWPHQFQQEVRQVWGPTSCAVYELLPLTRRDARTAAAELGLDSVAFMQEVEGRELGPLAARPLTLKFLLRLFERDGSLPESRSETYGEGCRLLCDEPSEARRMSTADRLSASERMALAERLAALTLLAGQSSIWVGAEDGSADARSIPVRELSGGSERTAEGSNVPASDQNIREVLATGLFCARGLGAFGWSHNSYAEFLAASYLERKSVPIEQIVPLLTSGGTRRSLIPQLRDFAAWSAALVPDLLDYLVDADPQILLHGDLAVVDEAQRYRLVDKLLESVDQRPSRLVIKAGASRLQHPTLTEQLRATLRDDTLSDDRRLLAVDIARECGESALSRDLIDLALDSSQPNPVRVHALHAVTKLPSDPSVSLLEGLLQEDGTADPDVELRGWSLVALWPEFIATEEVFSYLPFDEGGGGLVGGYYYFLSTRLVPSLGPADMPIALAWVADLDFGASLSFEIERAADSIIRRGLGLADNPVVLDALAQVVIKKSGRYEGFLQHRADTTESVSADARRALAKQVMLIAPKDFQVHALATSQTRLLQPSDFAWLVGLGEGSPQVVADRAATLAPYIFDRTHAESRRILLEAVDIFPQLRESMSSYIDAVPLGSEAAEKMRASWELFSKVEANQAPLLDPPPEERVDTFLTRFENGETDAWIRLGRDLSLTARSTHYEHDLELDITALPGWQSASAATRLRIQMAAKAYLEREATDPRSNRWTPGSPMTLGIVAGYRSFRLLLDQGSIDLRTMHESVWEYWAAALFGVVGIAEKDEQSDATILTLALTLAPEESKDAIHAIIRQESAEHADVFLVNRLESIDLPNVTDILAEVVSDGHLGSSPSRRILTLLLGRGHTGGLEIAASWVDDDDPALAVPAIVAMLATSPERHWELIWSAMEGGGDIARQALETFAASLLFIDTDALAGISEGHLADLYSWMLDAFPPVSDPVHPPLTAHYVTPREDVSRLRDRIPQHLASRGSHQAVEALSRLARNNPVLRAYVQQAEELLVSETWQPSAVSELRDLLSRPDKRLIRDGSDLAAALEESLARLQQRLRQEAPSAMDLWNELTPKTHRPKRETHLAYYVKRHLDVDLRERGVVVNREVEIRQGTGGAPGERTDLYVDAVTPVPSVTASVKAVIETKGCWNRELMSAMESQLVGRYLRESEARTGIYLVGWFVCEQWDREDPRRTQVPRMSLSEVREALGTQAGNLSTSDLNLRAIVLDVSLR